MECTGEVNRLGIASRPFVDNIERIIRVQHRIILEYVVVIRVVFEEFPVLHGDVVINIDISLRIVWRKCPPDADGLPRRFPDIGRHGIDICVILDYGARIFVGSDMNRFRMEPG